jgi:two-component system chemotaxis sensor kinase CheA
MDGLEAQLAAAIDRALETVGAGAPAKLPDDVPGLFAAVSQYLAEAKSEAVRSLAQRVAEFSEPDSSGERSAAAFRCALEALRDSLNRSSRDLPTAAFYDDPELVQEFLVESREHLANVEAGMLTLEREPDNIEALNAVFRSFHTIKGLAGFMGAHAVQEIAHVTEDVLDRARSGNLALCDEIVELVLQVSDELNKCLDRARTCRLVDLPECDPSLIAAMASLAETSLRPDKRETRTVAPEPLNAGNSSESASIATAQPAAKNAPLSETPAAAQQPQTSRKNAESSVVRIETAKLEYLIDMVGELVIAESVVRNNSGLRTSKDPLLSRNLTQLARVVQEVQKTSMSMRMVPIGSLFRKMSRLIRDLARKSGKSVELITVGDDVELDRSIVEDLADPMVHMIRNAVDHGLELPQERAAAAKPPMGTVRLKAMHDAGDIVIELSDDGRGMDPARILAKARRQGLVGQHDTPDEDTIFRMIFEAGFSTAEKVTDMSGRGVGMDVVKKQIQKLRGRIAIRSVLGQGCSFVLRLPLTLAIIDGLVVGVGAQRFILPVFAVREMFSPKPGTFVTLENRAEAALYRDKLLPVIRLSRLFETANDDRQDGVLIVTEARDQLYCIAVDQLIGKQEVVIKTLGKAFREIPAISGGAILGDGRVGLIIDVNSLRYQG